MPDFTGQFGGLIAVAFIAGVGLGWSISEITRVMPVTKRLERAEADVREIYTTLKDRWLKASGGL